MVWVVAGCLFEVSLPADGRWRWTPEGAQVTLLGEAVRDGRQHLRFRAEVAGVVELQFGGNEAELRSVTVRIVPERLDGEG